MSNMHCDKTFNNFQVENCCQYNFRPANTKKIQVSPKHPGYYHRCYPEHLWSLPARAACVNTGVGIFFTWSLYPVSPPSIKSK